MLLFPNGSVVESYYNAKNLLNGLQKMTEIEIREIKGKKGLKCNKYIYY